MHYDNWKLSNPIDDGFGTSMVSNCCGGEYVDSIDNENDIETMEDYVCCECQDYCDIIEEDEYQEIQRENYEDDRADAKRKYNE